MNDTEAGGNFPSDLKIEGIKIYRKAKRVEIKASSSIILPIWKQIEAEKSFREKFEGFDAELSVKFKTDLHISRIIAEYKDSILYILGEKMPSSKGILEDSIWEMSDEGKLLITLKTNGVSLLKEKKCDGEIRDIFENSFDKKVRVEFRDASLNEEYKKDYMEFKESEESKILSAADKVNLGRTLAVKIAGDRSSGTGRKAENPSETALIKGKNFKDEPSLIAEIGADVESAAVSGNVYKTDYVVFKNKMNMCKFYLTDGSGSVTVKFFYNKDEDDKLKAILKDGIHVKVRGVLKYDSFEDERVLNAKDIMMIPRVIRNDNAAQKRVELHMHTRMSSMDGVSTVESLVETAAKWGHKAIAITDHGVVQAFPDAYKAGKKAGIKVIYGVECYLMDDDAPVFYYKEGQEQDESYVVLDIETTGLDPSRDKITEIGAVRVIDGNITGMFKSFVNPGVHIPEKITKITGINDAMVRDAPQIQQVLPQLMKFAGKSILSAHNSQFDMSFIKKAASDAGIMINNPICDTLQMSRNTLPGLPNYRLETVAGHLGVNKGESHRALDDATAAAGILVKCLGVLKAKGIEGFNNVRAEMDWKIDFTKRRSYHAIILVKNKIGLRNLYELISYSHLNHYFHKKPRIPRRLLMSYREGLLLATACQSGELYTAVREECPQRTLEHIAEFYDFLEIQPLENNRFLISNGSVKSEELLREINRKIAALGEKCNKPVIATCDVHFLSPGDEIFRRILMAGQGYPDAEWQAPLYLRTTEEMLGEFGYLGPEKAYETVVTNTNLVADMIEPIIPVPEGTFAPKIEGAEEQLKEMSEKRAAGIYGEILPEIVRDRMKRELDSIIKNGFSVMYVIAQKLVKKSLEDGYLVGSRGSVGSSLIAYLSGITEVNSLPPHYICGECKYSEFITDGSAACGFDLPDKKCPVCGKDLNKDGHDIPFETFLGFEGEKEPDIDLNFSGLYQASAHKYTEELFGAGHVFRAGTISTLADKTAYGYVKNYLDERNLKVSKAELERLIQGCSGIKKTTGQHPGGVMIVPHDKNIYEFTPVQHPADDEKTDIVTTHFDYHSISGKLLKLDLLGHDDPTVIKMLEDLTGVEAREIPIGEKKTMSIFCSTEALGVRPEDIGSKVGTFGIPEFGTSFVRQMLLDTNPTTFAELIRIAGLSHGTDVWLNNAQELIRAKKATLSEVICTRDDIMLNLIKAGLEPRTAFKISEDVRNKNKGLLPEDEDILKAYKIPDWYIQSCKKIKYMFPKAHAAAYVTMAFRIAWFKVYYPIEFYTAYYTVRANDFDAEIMTGGPDRVKAKIEEIQHKMKENSNSATQKEKDMITVLEVVMEMYARGIKFVPIDLYKSDAIKFEITPDGIRPPFNALQGLGESAAAGIAEARGTGEFRSLEDLRTRSGVSKTVIKVLEDSGCLDGLPESNQISMF